MSFLFDKVKGAVNEVGDKLKQTTSAAVEQTHAHTHHSNVCSDDDSHHLHRFQSFAPEREGNEVTNAGLEANLVRNAY